MISYELLIVVPVIKFLPLRKMFYVVETSVAGSTITDYNREDFLVVFECFAKKIKGLETDFCHLNGTLKV